MCNKKIFLLFRIISDGNYKINVHKKLRRNSPRKRTNGQTYRFARTSSQISVLSLHMWVMYLKLVLAKTIPTTCDFFAGKVSRPMSLSLSLSLSPSISLSPVLTFLVKILTSRRELLLLLLLWWLLLPFPHVTLQWTRLLSISIIPSRLFIALASAKTALRFVAGQWRK